MLNPMVADAGTLDTAFQALAHPARRAMLTLLADRERTVGELAEPFDVSLAASSKHVKVLERAGLVRRTVRGRVHSVRLEVEPLRRVTEWTERCREAWEHSFQRLDAVLDELKALDPGAGGDSPAARDDPSRTEGHTRIDEEAADPSSNRENQEQEHDTEG
jgi:DNA-binding transcriptional ArsR family regulator